MLILNFTFIEIYILFEYLSRYSIYSLVLTYLRYFFFPVMKKVLIFKKERYLHLKKENYK